MKTKKRKSVLHSEETNTWRENFQEKNGMNLAVSLERETLNLTPSLMSPISPNKKLIKFIGTDSEIGGGSHHLAKSKLNKNITMTSSQNTIRGTVHAEQDQAREFGDSDKTSNIEFIKFGSKDEDNCNFRSKIAAKNRSASKGQHQHSRSSISLTPNKKEFQLD